MLDEKKLDEIAWFTVADHCDKIEATEQRTFITLFWDRLTRDVNMIVKSYYLTSWR